MTSPDHTAAVLQALAAGPATSAEIAARAFPGWTVPDARRVTADVMFHLTMSGDADTIDGGRLQISGRALAIVRASDRRPLDVMRPAAERLAAILAPLAKRLEIAGSIRRQAQDCGDIELCAMSPSPALGLELKKRAVVLMKSGPKYTQVVIEDDQTGPVKVDLFSTDDPAQWGMLLFIRTGSADFVRRALGYWKKISGGGYCEANRLYTANANLVHTPEEADVFRALECPFVAPEKRVPRT